MDSSQGPDMTLSLGGPALNTTVIHKGACLKGKLCHEQLAQSPRNYSAGLKRKREKIGTVVGTEVSGLSFENGNDVKVLTLDLCRPSSRPCISTESGAALGTMLISGLTEEDLSVGLGLGPAGPKSYSVVDGSVTTMARPNIADPSERGMPGLTNTTLKQRGDVTDIDLRLGPSHCHPIGRNRILEDFNVVADSRIDKDLGTQLQLSLSNSSTIICDADCVSYMSLRHVSSSTHPESRSGSFWDKVSITADDEGSTSRHVVKTGRRAPSLDFGGRDSISLLEGAGLYPAQANFAYQRQNSWYNEKSNKSDEPSGSVQIASRNSVDFELLPSIQRTPNACKFQNCCERARGASGLCKIHGWGRRCLRQGCTRATERCTWYCKLHGNGSRRQSLGCKGTEERMGYCIGHGGIHRCSEGGCTKAARGCSGLCLKRSGGKQCQEGCTKNTEGLSGLCMSRGGGRCCQAPEGNEDAQGSTRFSKTHDCEKRCMIQACTRGAEGNRPLCKGHGGGKRFEGAIFEGDGICTKSVHAGCVVHVGGNRCALEGCTKSVRHETSNCVRHSGGKICKFKRSRKSAQGSTDFCKTHGGGKRCCWGQEGSPHVKFFHDKLWELSTGPCDRFARGKSGLCAAHSAFVLDQRVHGADVIGSSFPAGIDPGLFRGLVMNTLTQDRVKTELASKHPSQESTETSEQSCKDGPDSRAGLDSFKRQSGIGDTGSCKDQVTFVGDQSRHVGSAQGESAGCEIGFKYKGTHVFGMQNQIQSPTKLISNIEVPKNRYLPAHVLDKCKPNQTIYMKGGSHGANYFTGLAASTTESMLSSREKHALLPPQVLVPPSMRNAPFLQSHGNGNINIKHSRHSRTGSEEESGGSNFASLSTGEARVLDGGEQRVHGGRILMSLSEKNAEGTS